MLSWYGRFTRGLASNWVGSSGVVLTTTAFLLFLFFESLRLIGVLTNSYIGLISYLLFPAVFVLGLVLIPIGWWRHMKQTGRSTKELLSEQFDDEVTQPKLWGNKLILTIAALTVVNLLFLGGGSARMLQFMDEPEFCGTACHSVMGPEWAVYQQSPHAHVKCVECHVGEGADALVDSKINGMWQMISVTFDLFERPIPTPVHNLRPARETCEKCHWPAKFYGQRIKRITGFDFDRDSTPRYTTLALKVGSGEGKKRGEIHWHIASANQVRYLADQKRERMIWVEVKRPDGSFERFLNGQMIRKKSPSPRVLDCVDCHNRATHIYEDPERAVDERLARGELDRSVPFMKREALAALTGHYSSNELAEKGIRRDLVGSYDREQSLAHAESLERASQRLGEVYSRNVHHGMNVGWNAYPDHLGHKNGGGCFRCHNDDLVSEKGRKISSDCTLCHSVLANDSAEPFQYLKPVEKDQRDGKMHQYFQDEFLGP